MNTVRSGKTGQLHGTAPPAHVQKEGSHTTSAPLAAQRSKSSPHMIPEAAPARVESPAPSRDPPTLLTLLCLPFTAAARWAPRFLWRCLNACWYCCGSDYDEFVAGLG